MTKYQSWTLLKSGKGGEMINMEKTFPKSELHWFEKNQVRRIFGKYPPNLNALLIVGLCIPDFRWNWLSLVKISNSQEIRNDWKKCGEFVIQLPIKR